MFNKIEIIYRMLTLNGEIRSLICFFLPLYSLNFHSECISFHSELFKKTSKAVPKLCAQLL